MFSSSIEHWEFFIYVFTYIRNYIYSEILKKECLADLLLQYEVCMYVDTISNIIGEYYVLALSFQKSVKMSDMSCLLQSAAF